MAARFPIKPCSLTLQPYPHGRQGSLCLGKRVLRLFQVPSGFFDSNPAAFLPRYCVIRWWWYLTVRWRQWRNPSRIPQRRRYPTAATKNLSCYVPVVGVRTRLDGTTRVCWVLPVWLRGWNPRIISWIGADEGKRSSILTSNNMSIYWFRFTTRLQQIEIILK